MYNVIIENESGESIDLMREDNMICVDIEGASGSTATINETKNANIDGSTINSERIDSRPITLTVRIFGDYGNCRTKLYHYAVIKKNVKLTLINDVRSVYVEGKVKSIDGDPFTERQQMVITILCPDSFFSEIIAIEKEFSNIIDMFVFPFEIEEAGIPFGVITDIKQSEVVNVGETDSGLEFVIKANDEVINPKIINMLTGEYIKLNYTMIPNEIIKIGTINKKKYVISIIDNVKTNIINSFDLSSTWLKARVGNNNFTYVADEGEEHIEAFSRFQNKYSGI